MIEPQTHSTLSLRSLAQGRRMATGRVSEGDHCPCGADIPVRESLTQNLAGQECPAHMIVLTDMCRSSPQIALSTALSADCGCLMGTKYSSG
jgi:hypothetical protein